MSSTDTSSPPSLDAAWAASILGLRGLLAAMIDAMWRLPVGSDKMVRHARAILRLTRIVIALEVDRYHSALKDKMLADPAWRGRVFAELGGVHGMQRWQARFAFHQHADPNSFRGHDAPHHNSANDAFANHAFTNHDGAKIHSRYKTDSAGQFRLAPLPRPSQPHQFLGRADNETGERRSAFHQPIPLLPRELTPRAMKPPPPSGAPPSRGGADTHNTGTWGASTSGGAQQGPQGTSHKPP